MIIDNVVHAIAANHSRIEVQEAMKLMGIKTNDYSKTGILKKLGTLPRPKLHRLYMRLQQNRQSVIDAVIK